jgi:hypothetical protein
MREFLAVQMMSQSTIQMVKDYVQREDNDDAAI